MDNKGIANVFEEIANILDISGANFFRVNAYRKAALTILNLPQDLRTQVVQDPNSIEKIPGIGKDLKNKIIELVETGKCQEHEKLKKGFPTGLLDILQIRGLGPKKVKALYMSLAIKNIEELERAANNHLIRDLPGMGEKTETEILKAIGEHRQFSTQRHYINEAKQEAERYIEYLKECTEITKVQYAGSLRRQKETIGDIDILATVKNAEESHQRVMKHFVAYGEVINIIAEGDTKSSVILQSGIQVDLRVVADKSFGAALHYFTGSKEHNVKIRDLAKKKGLKVNEYGVFKDEEMVSGATEEELFEYLGLPYFPPEVRKDDGEIEYGLKHKKFPKLVEIEDIRGDLHSHSTYSDGKNSIEEMAAAFIARGYEYFAVTDHSTAVGITRGMNDKNIEKQWKEIDKLQKKLGDKIKILKGSEVDILKDGTLDFEDKILKQLDIVIISAHLHNRLPAEEQTKRLIRAIENPYVKILGHPTGRLVNRRAPMEFDMKKIIDACIVNKVALEINSNPMRLDLMDRYVRIAKDQGAKFVIDTDAHSIDHPAFIEFGVGVAKSGWLTKGDVLNTKSISQFDSYFQ